MPLYKPLATPHYMTAVTATYKFFLNVDSRQDTFDCVGMCLPGQKSAYIQSRLYNKV